MKKTLVFTFCLLFVFATQAQPTRIQLEKDAKHPLVKVTINGKFFTQFFFPDTIAKPVLYPIHAPNGTMITRGYPVTPIAGEPTDHPHHLGLWLNFGDVNGLDFWNNSFAIPADKKHLYGNIRMGKILEMKSGPSGFLRYDAYWNDHKENTLLNEETRYYFKELNGHWVIDRVTRLTAKMSVQFKDNKEGMLGLRMAHELQIPAVETKKFKDANGIETIVKAVTDTIANGTYLNSNGIKGDDVWGKKAEWNMMYAKMKNDSISVLILDHPLNQGYPTYWHARGYGLFAANPMGSNVFSKANPEFRLSLESEQAIVYRYRIVFAAGEKILDRPSIEKLKKDFSQLYPSN